MDNLITCGFVSKHQQWSLKTKKRGRQSIYNANNGLESCYGLKIGKKRLNFRDNKQKRKFSHEDKYNGNILFSR
jgi:hypothetical protein